MRFLQVAFTFAAVVGLASNALAINDSASLAMHADGTIFGGCALAENVCEGTAINTGPAAGIPTIYLVVRNFDSLRGVQTAFDWSSFGAILGAGWNCQNNQLSAVEPNDMTTGGPTDGTIATAFDPIGAGATAVIGRMNISVSGSGCIVQVLSSFENGNHVLSTDLDVTQIAEVNWGSVCATGPGVDACQSVVPVLPSTWGSIKAQYNNN